MLQLCALSPRFHMTSSHSSWSWKFSLEVMWSSPLLRQSLLELSVHDPVQAAFSVSPSCKTLDNLCQCLLIFTGKNMFADVKMQYPVFLSLAIASGPVTGQPWEELGSLLFAPFLQEFVLLIKIPLNLLFPRRNSASLPDELSPGHSTSTLGTVLSRAEGSPPQPAGHALPNAPKVLVTFFVAGVPHSLMPNWVSPRTPWSLSAKLLSCWVWVSPSTYWCLELFSPGVVEKFLSFLELLWAHLSCKPVKVPVDGNKTLWHIGHCSQFGWQFGIICQWLDRTGLDPVLTPGAHCWSLASKQPLWHWSPSGPCHSASFLSAHPAHTLTAPLWRSYGRQCQRARWSPRRWCALLSPFLPGQLFHHIRLSSHFKHDLSLLNLYWLLLVTFLSFMYLETVSRVSWSIKKKKSGLRKFWTVSTHLLIFLVSCVKVI